MICDIALGLPRGLIRGLDSVMLFEDLIDSAVMVPHRTGKHRILLLQWWFTLGTVTLARSYLFEKN